MDNFNPVIIEDELKVSKEDLENCDYLKANGNIKKLEGNEYIGTISFYTKLEKYPFSNTLTVKLKFCQSDRNLCANVTFYVPSVEDSFNGQKVNKYSWVKDIRGRQEWYADICTLTDVLNPEKNFLVNGELIIQMKTMVFKNPYPNSQEKMYSALPRLLWNRDFVIAVGAEGELKGEIKVHKHILASRSPVFGRMLETDMKAKAHNRLEISDCDVEVVRAVVEYFYDRDIYKSLDTDNLIDLFLFADKYGIKDLKDELEVHFLFHIYPDTIDKIATTSIVIKSEALQDACIKALDLYNNENVFSSYAETLDNNIQKELLDNSIPDFLSRIS